MASEGLAGSTVYLEALVIDLLIPELWSYGCIEAVVSSVSIAILDERCLVNNGVADR